MHITAYHQHHRGTIHNSFIDDNGIAMAQRKYRILGRDYNWNRRFGGLFDSLVVVF
jgi:hypothetical protein